MLQLYKLLSYYIHNVIASCTKTVTYHGVCQSQPGTSSHLVLWFYTDPAGNYIVGGIVRIMRRHLMLMVIQILLVQLLVEYLRWEVTINYDAHLDDVPKHITGQENSLHGSSLRTFLTEFFAPTFLIIIIRVLRTCAEVLVQLTDMLSHISEVPCKEDDGQQNTHTIAENRDLFFLLFHAATTLKCRGW